MYYERVQGSTGRQGKVREVFPIRKKLGNFKILTKSSGILGQSGNGQGRLYQKISKITWKVSINSRTFQKALDPFGRSSTELLSFIQTRVI